MIYANKIILKSINLNFDRIIINVYLIILSNFLFINCFHYANIRFHCIYYYNCLIH